MISCTEPDCECPTGVCVQRARPSRWAVVYWAPERRERHFDDRALADAYAAAHHGELLPMVSIRPWPRQPAAAG